MQLTKKISYYAGKTEFSRYLCAGTLTFLIDFIIYFVLTELFDISYLFANLVGVCAGILTSYFLCVKWVFYHRRYQKVLLEFPLFTLTCMVGVTLNELTLWIVVEFMSIHHLVAKVIVTAIIFVFNFFFKKLLLFRTRAF